MQVEVVLPELDDNKAAVFTVERWLCPVGMSVRKGEPLLQVRGGATLHTVSAPRDGHLVSVRVGDRANVRPGAVLAVLDSESHE